MNKKITLLGIILLSVGFFSWNSMNFNKKFTSAPPASKTGAPNGSGGFEGTCTDCHTGSVSPGNHTVSFSGANNQYDPGQTYTMTLDIGGNNAKNGFQIVALRDSDNTGVGSWNATGGDESTMSNAGLVREYIGHSAAGTSQTNWSFEWVAPAQGEGDITFYVIVNETDNNTNTSNDVVTSSSFSISQSTASINEEKFQDVSMNFIPFGNEIIITGFKDDFGKATLELIDLSGKTIERKKINNIADSYNWKLSKTHEGGIYLISVRNNEEKVVKKLFIQ